MGRLVLVESGDLEILVGVAIGAQLVVQRCDERGEFDAEDAPMRARVDLAIRHSLEMLERAGVRRPAGLVN